MKAHPENVCHNVASYNNATENNSASKLRRQQNAGTLMKNLKKEKEKLQVILIISWPKQCCAHSHTRTAMLNLHGEKNIIHSSIYYKGTHADKL